jgi:hypothetical protein
MGRRGIDRKLVRMTAIVSVPLELIALFGLYTFLFDTPYPMETSQWWFAFGVVGFCVHFFGIVLVGSVATPNWASLLIIPFFGYATLFFLGIEVAFWFRIIKEVVSTRCLRDRNLRFDVKANLNRYNPNLPALFSRNKLPSRL